MTDWLILGPVPGIDLEEDYLVEVGGESHIEPKEEDKFLTKDGKFLTWTRYQSEKDLIDFLKAIGLGLNSTVYAFSYIEISKEDDDVQFYIGKDDGAAVWIEGRRVYLNPENSPHLYNDEVFHTKLKKGINRCMVKIFQGLGGWSFSIRALPDSRGEITGQIFDDIGNPVPSAWVRIEQEGQLILQRQADTQGQYRLSVYPHSHSYDLAAWSGKTGDWLISKTFQHRERKKYDFKLKQAVGIQGSILMLDQQSPHVGIVVQALKPSQERAKSGLETSDQIIATTLTDDRGQYQFINLKPGAYHIRCHIPGRLVYFPDGITPRILTVTPGRTNRNISFHLPAFKKGTWRNYTTFDGLAGNSVNYILKYKYNIY